eukprot:6559_1
MSTKVGLLNQGATCYLSSLIQISRFTPEFYSELLSIEKEDIYNDNNQIRKDKEVLWQVVKILAEMELTCKKLISTKPLTDAFGWNTGQVLQQHDINEAYNILLDGINRAMPGNKKFFNKYYTGKICTIMRCLECENISKNKEHFTQLNLNIIEKIANGHQIPFNNVYGSLISEFLKTEDLLKENKYYCNECETKVNAKKMCRLIQLPVILILNMNQYAISNGIRRKLNACLTCPLTLDLSMFLDPEYVETDLNITAEYDLSAIVVHGGGTIYGHYYAYARSWKVTDDEKENDKIHWFKFDDKKVTEHSQTEIQQLFIQKGKFIPYMVMYRRKYMNDSAMFPSIPDYIQEAIEIDSDK